MHEFILCLISNPLIVLYCLNNLKITLQKRVQHLQYLKLCILLVPLELTKPHQIRTYVYLLNSCSNPNR